MISFDVIDLEQGSDEWRLWRAGGIGASDAPAIMGENPRKSIEQLKFERSNPRLVTRQNPAMVRGTFLEPRARDAYCRRMGFQVRPLCVQSKERPWLRCSLDGICLDRMHMVEIKCGISTYRHVHRHGRPPRRYHGQLQHALAVTNLEAIDLWCYSPDRRPLLVTVERESRYIETLIENSWSFWKSLSEHGLHDA